MRIHIYGKQLKNAWKELNQKAIDEDPNNKEIKLSYNIQAEELKNQLKIIDKIFGFEADKGDGK